MVKERFPVRWLGLSLVLGIAIYLVVFLLVQLRVPSDGFSDGGGILVGDIDLNRVLSPQPGSLRLNDVVQAIEGVPIAAWRERAWQAAGPPSGWQIGQQVTYTVLRRGETVEVPVILHRLSLWQILRKGGSDFLTGLIFLIITLSVFLKQPHDPGARLFFLAGLSFSFTANITAIAGLQPSDLVNRTPFLLFTIPEIVTFWLNFSLLVHFFLVFPRRHPLLESMPWLLWVIYLALPVISLGTGLSRGFTVSEALAIADQVRFPIAIIYLVGGLAVLFHNFLTLRTRTEHNQLRWILWGIGISLIPWLFLFALPITLLGHPLIPIQLANLALAIAPLSFAFSIIRYRLFDIDTLIQRSLVYGLLSALLVAGYSVLVAFLSRLGAWMGVGEGLLPPTIAALFMAALFDPARNWVQTAIDRTLYPDRLAFQRLPLELSRELSTTMDFDSVVKLLTETVPSRLNITEAELLTFAPEKKSWVPVLEPENGSPLPHSEDLNEYLIQQDTAIPLFRPEKRPRWLAPLADKGVEVCVPLVVEQRPVGIYNLKAKKSAEYYSRQELEILANLGNQAAISITNARSYQTVSRLNRHLEVQAQENERLFREERARANQLALISAVSREVTSILEVDRLLNTVIQLVRSAFNYQLVSIGLVEERDGRPVLVCRAVAGHSDRTAGAIGFSLPLDGEETLTTKVVHSGRPLLVPDVSREPLYRKLSDVEDVAAELTVPLIAQDNVIGVLDIGSSRVNAFDEEDLRTMQSLAAQVAVAIENARLYEQLSEQERLQSELRIAHAIQASLLPQASPQVPGLQIYGTSLPAKEVGGDFFAYFPRLNGDSLGIAVGDVSGTGIPGSLFMAVSISALRAQAGFHDNTASLMGSMNQVLFPQMHANHMNAAMLYAKIDPVRLRLQVSNAGLIAPLLILREKAGRSHYLDVSGLPLGAIPDAEYQESVLTLAPGDLIVMCSDGVVEARNPRGDLFGFARLEKAVQEGFLVIREAEALAQHVLKRVKEFTAGQPVHDDMTLVVVVADGSPGS